VCRLHDSHGRDARATTLEAPWPPQFRLPQQVPGVWMAKHVSPQRDDPIPKGEITDLQCSGWSRIEPALEILALLLKLGHYSRVGVECQKLVEE